MVDDGAGNVTAILRAARAGNREAADRLLPLVYAELRKLAKARLARQPPGSTLQPTALVNEAYLRLIGKANLHLESRRHFFFAAARAMRDILVEQARGKARSRRGGGPIRRAGCAGRCGRSRLAELHCARRWGRRMALA